MLPTVTSRFGSRLDAPSARTDLRVVDLTRVQELFRLTLTARWVDRVEMELVNRGEGFFHVGGAGHEATATLAAHLLPADWLHLHYRDKALMLARGVPAAQFFHSLLCTAASHSAGRQMSAHLSAPELHLLSLVGPVGNNALQAVGVAHEIGARTDTSTSAPRPLVVCAVGDGTTQQGEVLEAIAEAVRARLPVLFLVADNGLAISTRTRGQTFFDLPSGPAAEFYGCPIHRLEGRDPLACDAAFAGIVGGIRAGGGPALVVMRVERLTHHTNADDERLYRSDPERAAARAVGDPLEVLREALVSRGVRPAELAELEVEIEATLRAAAAEALVAANPRANLDARPPWKERFARPGTASTPPPMGQTHTLLESMKAVLRNQLGADGRVSLLGEDIEDPKGDVFGLTRGLSLAFPGQVRNAALSESTIVGVGIGRALAGGRPVAFIQFADFLPLAYNQIASELGSLWWRSAGAWSAPVILLAPCGGYRPGLGPFHAQTFESVYAHVPGLDVCMPSTAEDAAGLLNAAFVGGRPTLFLYPKLLLNDAAVAMKQAPSEAFLEPGRARRVTTGADLTVVSWGATVPLCLRVVRFLETAGLSVELLDLRTLSPWDADAVVASAKRTGKLLVVHEDNLTCGFGAEVLATVAERSAVAVRARRVTRPDTYVPCNYVNQLEVLPSFPRILTVAAELCGLELDWIHGNEAAEAVYVLEAVGSSPADQNVKVLAWRVPEGANIVAGDLLADCEADKATFELRAPETGRIFDLMTPGESVPIGTPIARIQRLAAHVALPKRVPVEPRPEVRGRRAGAVVVAEPVMSVPKPSATVIISGIASASGGRRVSSAEIAARFPGRTEADVIQRTGIQSRPQLAADESVLSLATRAARDVLRAGGLTLADVSSLIVSTSSPLSISPSLACRLQHALAVDGPVKDLPAYDILAACSGYLYALQQAFDACQSRPDSTILVVTAEAMSRFVDPGDFDTAIVFADAATATLVHGSSAKLPGRARMQLHRPVLSARGEDGSVLNHGRLECPGSDGGRGACSPVYMDGIKVFPLAVRQMLAVLEQACAESRLSVRDLDVIIPHQANGRIIEAARHRLKDRPERVLNRVTHAGNSSSSTIPLVLAELLRDGHPGGKAGLCAFGAGFTFGAAVAELLP